MVSEKLRTIFSSVLGVAEDTVTNELSPENTPTWDSLNAIILVTEIEKAFDLKFSFDEAMSVKKFGDAVTLVTKRSEQA